MKTYLAGLLTRPRFTRLPIPTNRGSGKSTCANRLVGTHSSGSVRDFHPIPYYSVTRTRNGNQTLHINAAKIQYFFLTPTFLSVFFTVGAICILTTPRHLIFAPRQNALCRMRRVAPRNSRNLYGATSLRFRHQNGD